MNEDFGDVSSIGEVFGRQMHRGLKIKRCENGYIVDYTVESKEEGQTYRDPTTNRVRVFLTNTDLMEFVEKYFAGEPKP